MNLFAELFVRSLRLEKEYSIPFLFPQTTFFNANNKKIEKEEPSLKIIFIVVKASNEKAIIIQ